MTAFSDIFTFSRATKKWVQAANGDLIEVAVDEPAFDYSTGRRALLLEGQATNGVRNNTMQGATLGTLSTTGTLPTNWQSDNLLGGEIEIVGTGIEDGVDFIDIRFNGTPTGNFYVSFSGNNQYQSTEDDPIANSVFLSIVGGDETNIDNFDLVNFGRTSAGSFVDNVTKVIEITNELTRYTNNIRPEGATIERVNPAIRCDWTSGAVDITLRIGLPQIEKSDVATSPIKTYGSEVTRAADVIYSDDPEGLSGGYTVVIRGRLNGIRGNYDRLVQLDQGDNTNRQYVLWSVSNDAFSAAVYSDDASQSGTNLEGAGFGDDVVMGYTVNSSQFRAFINGVATPITSVAEFEVPDILRLAGSNTSGSSAPSSLSVYSVELLDKFSTQEELEAFEL